MKKVILLTAIFVLSLSSCTTDDEVIVENPEPEVQSPYIVL